MRDRGITLKCTVQEMSMKMEIISHNFIPLTKHNELCSNYYTNVVYFSSHENRRNFVLGTRLHLIEQQQQQKIAIISDLIKLIKFFYLATM